MHFHLPYQQTKTHPNNALQIVGQIASLVTNLNKLKTLQKEHPIGRHLSKKNILFNLKPKSSTSDGWMGSNLNADLRSILPISAPVPNKLSNLTASSSEE